MKKISLIFAGFLATCGFTFAQISNFVDYDKIPTWAKQAVSLVREKKIMTGFSDGTFGPDKNLNRAEALVTIFRLKGIDPKKVHTISAKSSFPDVPAGAWFAKAVIYATEQGWVKGFPDGKFHPEKELNKAELAELLKRVYDLPTDRGKSAKFSDVPEDAWFAEAVNALFNNDLVRHARAKKFFPARPVTRAEAAWIFAEILQKPRLMGTSKEANYVRNGRARSSRRVAIRRRDLNVNKQGYDIEKDAVYVNVYNKNGTADMKIGSDWVEIGNVILENKLSDEVTIDNISFRIRFDNAVGPARNFQLKIFDQYNQSETIDFPRTGTIFLTDWDKKIAAGKDYKFKVSLRAKNVTGYYPQKGEGVVYVSEIKGTALGKDRDGYTVYKKAPVVYNSRNFQKILFEPVVAD